MARQWIEGFELLQRSGDTIGSTHLASRGGVRRHGRGYSFHNRDHNNVIQRFWGAGGNANGTDGIALTYERFYVRIKAAPAANEIIWRQHKEGSQGFISTSHFAAQLRVNTSGNLEFQYDAQTNVASSNTPTTAYTHTTTLNTWYRVEVKVQWRTTTPDDSNLTIRIDGVEVYNAAPGGMLGIAPTTNTTSIYSSIGTGDTSNTCNWEVDDWSGDTSDWPGAGRISLVQLSGPGTYNEFTNSDWTRARAVERYGTGDGNYMVADANGERFSALVDLSRVPNLGTIRAIRFHAVINILGVAHTWDFMTIINGSETYQVSGWAGTTLGTSTTSTSVAEHFTTRAIDVTISPTATVEIGLRKASGSTTAARLFELVLEVEHDGVEDSSDDESDRAVEVEVGTWTGTGATNPITLGFEPDVIIAWRNGSSFLGNSLWWHDAMGENGQRALTMNAADASGQVIDLDGTTLTLSSISVVNVLGNVNSYIAIRDRALRTVYRYAPSPGLQDDQNLTFPDHNDFTPDVAFVALRGTALRVKDLMHVGNSSNEMTNGMVSTNSIQLMASGVVQVGTAMVGNTDLPILAFDESGIGPNLLYEIVTWIGNASNPRVIPTVRMTGRQLDAIIVIPHTTTGTTQVGLLSRHQDAAFMALSNTTTNIGVTNLGVGEFTVNSAYNANGVTYVALVFVGGRHASDTCPTPTEGEDLCTTIDDPVLFASWAPGDGDRYWFAETCLDDPTAYYGGWKEDRLLEVSEIRRALSGTNYDYEIGNFSVLLADDDYFIRSKLGTSPTSYFARREVEVYAVTPEGRQDQVTARRLGLGFVDQDPNFDERTESMTVRFTCRDRIGASIGWTVNGQQKLPRRVITQINLPGAGSAVLGKGAPIPYGIVSTYVQPSGNALGLTVPIPSGLTSECAFFEGTPPNEFWQTGYGNLVLGPDAPASVNAVAQSGGSLSYDVPSATYYIQVFPVNSAGQIGDPTPFCNDGLPIVVSSGTQQIAVSWAPSAGAASYAVFLGTRYYDVDFHQWLGVTTTGCVFTANPPFGTPPTTANITPGAAVAGDVFFAYYKIRSKNGDYRSELNTTEVYGITTPFLPNNQGYRPIRVRWRTTGAPQYEVLRRPAGGNFDRMWVVPSSQFNNGLHYFEDDLRDTGVIYLGGGETSQPVGAMPVFYAGREVLPNQEEWGRLLIAGCAIRGVDDWYYFQDTPNFQTEITQGDGVDFLFPKDDSAWYDYFPVPYRDILGTDGVTRRWTFGYVRGDKLAMIEAGSGTVSINLRGVEDIGNGLGDVLTDIHDQFRHFLRTQVSVSGEGYIAGEWAETPRFGEDEICTIDDTAFAALQEQRIAEYGSALTGAGVVGGAGTLTTVSEELKRWGTCMEARIGPNRFWQITTAAIDENLSASGIASISDEHDIHRRSFKPMPRQSELFNVIPYRYAPNYVSGGWTVDGQQYVNEDSVNRHGFRQESAPIEFHYLRDPASVAFVLAKRARRQADIPTYVTLEGSLCLTGASYDVGRYIRLDHWRGVQMSGWRNRPLWILSNTINPSTRRVRLECLDVTRLVPSGVGS